MKWTKITLVCLTLISCFLGWSFWFEPSSLHNKNHEIVLPSWPSTCNHIRITILSDLHVGSPFNGVDNLRKVIQLTANSNPDLILLAGDYVIHGVVGGTFVPPEVITKVLSSLKAPMGVYAVLGNHDWWFDAPRVQKALESEGIMVLEDKSVAIQKEKCKFWLAGISDYWKGPHDIDKALHQIPELDPIMVITHNPDIFPLLPNNVTLTIAGHTHGGQVYIPGVGRPIVPSEHGERFAIGHIEENGRHMFVSSGLGTSIIPIRFLVPPEVSILTIHSQEKI